jgi:hypothetical protein
VSQARRFAPAAFVRRLAAVPEPGMRAALWQECFTQAEATHLLDIVETLLTRSAEHQVAYLSLVRFLEQAPVAATDRLKALAEVTGRDGLLSHFETYPPRAQADPAALKSLPARTDGEITLGHRRWWAKLSDPNKLERLLYDQDPRVVQNLLNNPRIREQDVMRIVTRRPNNPDIMRCVFQHPRWGRQRPLQLAIALNPYSPVDVARSLVGLFDRATLARVAREPSVHAEVRAAAASRLRPAPVVELEIPDDSGETLWPPDEEGPEEG